MKAVKIYINKYEQSVKSSPTSPFLYLLLNQNYYLLHLNFLIILFFYKFIKNNYLYL